MRQAVLAAGVHASLSASASLPVAACDNKGPLTAGSDSEKKRDAEIDKAYRDAVKNRPYSGTSAKADPWQTIRTANSGDSTKR